MNPKKQVSAKEIQVAKETLERYSGCSADLFCEHILITNFPQYVKSFAKTKNVEVFEGSMFTAAHCKKDKISILDFKIGSPAAALVVDLCSYLPIQACIFLGMCGGLRRRYKKGEYIIPVGATRGEGTSNYYFPIEVPALPNFLVQRAISEVLDESTYTYHIGITHTTNKRFWEFDENFKDHLKSNRAQAIDMECATLFCGSYRRKLPLGALLLISDLPLDEEHIKTKESAAAIFKTCTKDHIEKGIKAILKLKNLQKNKSHGAHRPKVSEMETEAHHHDS